MKVNMVSCRMFKFYLLLLVLKVNYLFFCEYKFSVVWNLVWNVSVISQYESLKLFYLFNVYLLDDISMGDSGIVMGWFNCVVDKEIVELVVNKMIGFFCCYIFRYVLFILRCCVVKYRDFIFF